MRHPFALWRGRRRRTCACASAGGVCPFQRPGWHPIEGIARPSWDGPTRPLPVPALNVRRAPLLTLGQRWRTRMGEHW